jgi:hypothetical protein
MSHIDHEIRRLNFHLKQARTQIGKQGDTIHHLRAEIAEVRLLNSRIERGELRAYERKYEIACEWIRNIGDENRTLREKLAANE